MTKFNELSKELASSFESGFIDCNYESLEKYDPKFLTNNYKEGIKVLTSLEAELGNCKEFYFSVAFITESGIQSLMQILKELEQNKIKGKIITSQYQNFTEPKALRRLIKLHNIDVKIETNSNFHAKGYIFKKKDDTYSFIIGSSNLTQNALGKNKEWNIRLSSLEDGTIMKNIMREFHETFEYATKVTDEWIDQYEQIYIPYRKIKTDADNKIEKTLTLHTINPNKMQEKALSNLDRLRNEGESKALLISATGTGKTYLAAFDVNKCQPKKMLFVVHREKILKAAQASFKKVSKPGITYGYLTGGKHDLDADYLFATVQSLAKESTLAKFSRDHFDYICIDETHRAGAESYQRLVKYFKPKFLLGMTATPERNDGFDIYSLFDHNIAYEIRLQEALEENFVCPFHYYGIKDFKVEGHEMELHDYKDVDYEDKVNDILKNINDYGYYGNSIHGLVFCSRVEEADTLSELFNNRGYQTISLSGRNTEQEREMYIERLEQDYGEDKLDYIFSVDILSEGVDIPKVNQIVMIRPTQSAIIFVQQLGRGLRKIRNKDYLVVIDFIGNYQSNFFIPIALTCDNSYNKDTIRRHIVDGSRMIPGASTVNFDKISKKRIFESIDKANFSDTKLIKTEYNNLKFKLGRIPKIVDYEKYDSMDLMRIFEKKNLGSYHNFLAKYEKDYNIEFNNTQNNMMNFVCSKLACGKRVDELNILKDLICNNGYTVKLPLRVDNIYDVLTNNFTVSKSAAKIFAESVFIETKGDGYGITDSFKGALENSEFREEFEEVIDFGIRRHQKHYQEKYEDTDLTLYKKYTYEDVCKLLKWDKNLVSLNMGGYKYDEGTNTFPVFINYNKDEGISDTINYQDRFVSPSKLVALSKQSRTSNSDEIKRIYDYRSNGMKLYLFIRKNKNDKTSKEFYFLGRIHPIGKPIDITMENTDKAAVEIVYELEKPINEELYAYITD